MSIRIKFKRNADDSPVIFDKLKDQGYTTYRMRKEKIMGEGTLQKIRNNDFVELKIIDKICNLGKCKVNDIIDTIAISDLEYCSIEEIMGKLKYIPEEQMEDFLKDYSNTEE